MSEKKVSLKEAQETINHLMRGVDPYSGEMIGNITYLEHPRTVACFSLINELLAKCIAKAERRGYGKVKKFSITKEEADALVFPSGDVGVKGIISAVNVTVDKTEKHGLSIITLYAVLKEIGLLEKSTGEGKVRTTTTQKSGMYGIKTVKSTFQGEEYDRIMYTDQAKEYIREQLPVWFGS